jgi:hypothetical protein
MSIILILYIQFYVWLLIIYYYYMKMEFHINLFNIVKIIIMLNLVLPLVEVIYEQN